MTCWGACGKASPGSPTTRSAAACGVTTSAGRRATRSAPRSAAASPRRRSATSTSTLGAADGRWRGARLARHRPRVWSSPTSNSTRRPTWRRARPSCEGDRCLPVRDPHGAHGQRDCLRRLPQVPRRADRARAEHAFNRVCWLHPIAHKVTKPYHAWTNGQAERMHRTVRAATVKTFHYETLDALRAHLAAFVTANNFARHPKALRWRTPFQAICEAWGRDPHSRQARPAPPHPGTAHLACRRRSARGSRLPPFVHGCTE